MQSCYNTVILDTLRPNQNGQHFADGILKRISFNENIWILIKILLKFVPKGPINNIPALVQIIAWRHPGDKPLSEPMMVSLLTHICVTRPQWVNELWPSDNTYHRSWSTLGTIMACHIFSAQLLPEPMLTQMDPSIRNKFWCNLDRNTTISLKKMHLNMLSAKWQPSCSTLNVLSNIMIFCECDNEIWLYKSNIKPVNDAWHFCRHNTDKIIVWQWLINQVINPRADSRFAPSQWETALLCNDVSHWLGTNLESALNPANQFPNHYYIKFDLLIATHGIMGPDPHWLTHLPPDKMVAILADGVIKCIFLNENDSIQIQISLKFVPRVPVDNKWALVGVTASCWTGYKPMSKPMLTQCTDANMWH